MELPPALRAAIAQACEGVAAAALADASQTLSRRYRSEEDNSPVAIRDDTAARAYLATRLPATYAAIRASLAATAQAQPDFAPRSMLDVGAGPGTALWAAADCWPDIDRALLIEASGAMRRWGERLAADLPVGNVAWRAEDVTAGLPEALQHDLVTLGYVLGEIGPADRAQLVDRLWTLTTGILVIVEPGTPAGWRRVLAARAQLLAAGAHVVAPCAHAKDCPLSPPDWCHFARRLARSRIHRLAKGAEVPWEDEKFSYLAMSRDPTVQKQSRVLARPRSGPGRVSLKLCRPDGTAAEQLLSRRDGAAYAAARRLGWGDAMPAE